MDDSENSSADEASPSSEAKKKTRTRTRAAKPRKSKAAAAAEAASAPELPLETAPRPSEESESAAPREREGRAPRERKADREERNEATGAREDSDAGQRAPDSDESASARAPRGTFSPRRPEAAREEQTQESAGEQSLARAEKAEAEDVPTRYSSDEDPGANVSDESPSAAPAAAPQPSQQPGGGHQHAHHEPRHGAERGGQHGGGGHGGGGHGGGDRNEPFWKRDKRNKRKRGKHGGGAPWQQGGGGQQHPAQPPPPSLQPVYGELPGPDRFNDLDALNARADEISSGGGEPIAVDKLVALNLGELTAEARRLGATIDGAPNRKQLLAQIFKTASEAKRPLVDQGYIDLTDKGHGFIVHEAVNYRLYPEDAYLPESLIKHFGLKRGHRVEVVLEAPREGERCASVVRVKSVMGLPPEEISKVKPFEDLVPYYPLQRILLESPEVQKDVSMRAVDILTPIGFGQRGLIVAPPRTGKTVLMQNMANSISENFPDAKLILLLIDERPEEVTDFKRNTRGEVVSSTFDEAPESHVHCAEMVGEKARRLVEMGQHVIILLDSITRLARAYNALASNSGKIMSGGMEATALQKPKRFFGAARNIEGAGSLTIIATALIDTGSRMDEVIFEEFKGTGNMELHLDRGLVDKRIFPAINMDRSGTRKEELIYHPEEMGRIYGLRRAMQGIPTVEAMEMLINRLKKTGTNAEFLMSLR
ncbi:MAG TPA: transcription termination factor Rho [Opitutaceae bacterium]|nr:transcription termination factor Rho [Opitutaceae bacterium]